MESLRFEIGPDDVPTLSQYPSFIDNVLFIFALKGIYSAAEQRGVLVSSLRYLLPLHGCNPVRRAEYHRSERSFANPGEYHLPFGTQLVQGVANDGVTCAADLWLHLFYVFVAHYGGEDPSGDALGLYLTTAIGAYFCRLPSYPKSPSRLYCSMSSYV